MDSDELSTVMTSVLSFSHTSSTSPESASLGHPHPSRDDESPLAPLPPPSPLTPLVIRPCGACKGLRRRCVTTCTLAPYFPPTQPLKFLAVHKVFGASNVSKFLQGIPEFQRFDAVDGMVYEATTRIRDPIYGCAGVISSLQKLVNQLQMELATTKAQLLNITSQQEGVQEMNNTCMEMKEAHQMEDFLFCDTTPY